MQKDGSVIVGCDFEIVGLTCTRLKCLYPAAWTFSNWNYGGQIAADFCDLLARNPGKQIQPVGPDIRDCAQFAPQFRLQAPVPVRRIKQPILQETAVDQSRLANDSSLYDRASLLTQWVITQVVGDGTDQVPLARQINQRLALPGIQGERLLAHDVLARFHHGVRLIVMQVVGGAEVNRGP